MIRDPFLKELVKRLSEVDDGKKFEACAVSLLRKLYRDLVPLPGGTDAGMDGSLEEGTAFLVATTSRDVIGNVTRSLNSHIQDGDGRRRIVVATSTILTNPQRARIRRRVQDLKFSLIELHDQASMAELLYHAPEWCHELLGLGGAPPALAVVPRGIRPFHDIPVVGRTREMDWLRTTHGDRLIVGQPGIGKTFLTRSLVVEGDALYAVQEGLEPLAEGLRATRCRTVIVENAHSSEGRKAIDNLLQLRVQCGLDFDIVADCWPREKLQLMSALRLHGAAVLELKPLNAQEIVSVIKACGIGGPALLLHGLVHQTRGYPGRAALLAHFCRIGAVEDVWRGEVLTTMARDLVALVGARAFDYLALFALGGDEGVPAAVVAQAAGASLDQVSTALGGLAAGGIIEEVGEVRGPGGDCFRVVPARLRPVLVRDTLFRTPRMPLVPDVIESVRRVEFTRAIIHARRVGAELDIEDLFRRVLASGNEKLWIDFIHAGEDLAQRFARERPVWSSEIAHALLHAVPELALPLLLEKAIGDERSTSGHTDHPLRQIEDWILSSEPDCEHHVRYCELLLEALESFPQGAETPTVMLRALRLVMTPRYEKSEQDPAEWDRFWFIRGIVSPDATEALATLWPRVLLLLERVPLVDWTPIEDMLWEWLHPGLHCSKSTPPAHHRIFDRMVRGMIADLAPLAAPHPAVLRQLLTEAETRRVAGLPKLDPESAVLFPRRVSYETWKEDEVHQRDKALALGRRWTARPPADLAQHLQWLKDEARLAGKRGRSMVWTAMHGLAEAAGECLPWVDAFLHAGLNDPEVPPVLGWAAYHAEPGWRERARKCLGIPGLAATGANLLLQCEPVVGEDVDAVVAAGRAVVDTIRDVCSFGDVSQSTIERLLGAEDGVVAAAIADGLWHRYKDKDGGFPAAIRPAWIRALVQYVEDEHLLEECVGHDAEVAQAFLENRLGSPRRRFRFEGDIFSAASRHLTRDQRTEFLARLTDSDASQELAPNLVGHDVGLFQDLLGRTSLGDSVRHAPLRRAPDTVWVEFATAALLAGVTPNVIADEAFAIQGVYCGSLVDRARSFTASWEQLLGHADHMIRLVAAAGLERAKAELRWAIRFESRQQGGWDTADA